MKRTFLTLIALIMLSSLLTACTAPATETAEASEPVKTTAPEPTEELAAAPKPAPDPTPELTPNPTPSSTVCPEAYSTILEEYRTLAGIVFSDIDVILDNEEWQKQNIPILWEEGIFWQPGIWSMPFHEDKDAYGYALKDLNGDGSDELLLLLKDYTVLAVFSTIDGQPKLLDRYWNRYDCYAIDESGLFYISCYWDSAEDWFYSTQRLSDDGSELLTIARYGMESYDYDTRERYTESHYYKVIDGKSYSEREIINKAEFDEFMGKHPVFTDWDFHEEITKSALVFIPILD